MLNLDKTSHCLRDRLDDKPSFSDDVLQHNSSENNIVHGNHGTNTQLFFPPQLSSACGLVLDKLSPNHKNTVCQYVCDAQFNKITESCGFGKPKVMHSGKQFTLEVYSLETQSRNYTEI